MSAHSKRCSASLTVRLIWFTLSLGLVPACGGTTQVSEWPEEPMPDYPSSPGEGAPTAAAPSDPRAFEEKSETTAATSSDWAARYRNQKALAVLEGKATYYGDSLSGHKTANGERYNPREFTAAHKKLPFGTVVRVVRVDTGKVTYVRINDRGPFGARDRIIDLSRAAAEQLQMIRAGVVPVRVEIVSRPDSA